VNGTKTNTNGNKERLQPKLIRQLTNGSQSALAAISVWKICWVAFTNGLIASGVALA
jgi:hypothetical protein